VPPPSEFAQEARDVARHRWRYAGCNGGAELAFGLAIVAGQKPCTRQLEAYAVERRITGENAAKAVDGLAVVLGFEGESAAQEIEVVDVDGRLVNQGQKTPGLGGVAARQCGARLLDGR